MKKFLLPLFAALSLALIAGGATAQKGVKPVPASGKMAAQPGAAPGVTTVKGIVKGAPTGKTFMIAQGKKTTTVDAAGAKLRYNGKFFSLDKLTSGSFVSATGALTGTNLKATE